MHIKGKLVSGTTVIGANVFVETGSFRLHRLQRIEHRRQLLVFNVDALDRFFRGVKGVRRYGRHSVADKTHYVPAENRHVADLFANEVAGKFLAGDNGSNTRHLPGLRHIDAMNARVRIGAAKNFAPQKARQIDIRRVHSAAADFVRTFRAQNGSADYGKTCHDISLRLIMSQRLSPKLWSIGNQLGALSAQPAITRTSQSARDLITT
jgi:hypothetical protein